MHIHCKTALLRSSWGATGQPAILALGAEKKFIHWTNYDTFGKFEKILKHFRNFAAPPPFRPRNTWIRVIKNFRPALDRRQLRLGVRQIRTKIGL